VSLITPHKTLKIFILRYKSKQKEINRSSKRLHERLITTFLREVEKMHYTFNHPNF